MIRVEGVSKVYQRGGAPALEGCSLTVPAGALFGLLGPNGAGKTTLVSVLLGLVGRDGGTVHIDGRDPAREPGVVRAMTGLVPQELAFYPQLTVAENLAFFGGVLGLTRAELDRRTDRAAEVAGLHEHLTRSAGRLSGGQKRRLNLALGLLGEPRLLCLDEPTVGIDPQSRAFILDMIRTLNAGGTTVLYTSHYLEEVQQLCDRVAVLDHGRIRAEGETVELLRRFGGNTLQVWLGGPLPAGFDEAVAALPGFVRLTRERLEIATTNPEGTLEHFWPVVRRFGVPVTGIRYGSRSLESVFLELTERGLRD